MTTVSELELLVKKLNLKTHFTGVRMKDELHDKPLEKECGIINLNDSDISSEENKKTGHWIAYFKDGDKKYHFCSYGSPPPIALIDYLGKPIYTHTFQLQSFNTGICGELSAMFLRMMDNHVDYFDVVLNLLSINNDDYGKAE